MRTFSFVAVDVEIGEWNQVRSVDELTWDVCECVMRGRQNASEHLQGVPFCGGF